MRLADLERRVAKLERANETTIIRMGQMQSAFDTIYAAWSDAANETDPAVQFETLFRAWQIAGSLMPKWDGGKQ
jgi:hypothetical protein